LMLQSCIVVYDETDGSSGRQDHLYFNGPDLIEVGWDCEDGGPFDDWYFWARAEDNRGTYDLSYLHIRIYLLLPENSDIVETRIHDHVHGFFEVEKQFYTIQCGDPVDVEYTVVDYYNNTDQYMLYW